jgi:UDP-2,3-diacylglucosamine pyrophosphatase LpxH
VIHGDQFDHGLIHGTGLHKCGSVIYNILQCFDRLIKKFIPKFSLSRPAKYVTKKCTTHISNYKTRAIEYAKELGCNVVITGHVHIPENKVIGQSCYLNCGDWIDNLSAVVETNENTFEIIKYCDIKDC